MQNIFITRLKELQGQNSVTAFARYLELPQNTVDCYVKGRRKPSVELVTRVCKKCGVSADWLLGLSDTREPSEGAAPAKALPIGSRKNPFAAETDILTEIAAMKRRMERLEAIATKQLEGVACCG